MADITLTITVPEQYQSRVLEAVTAYAGSNLQLRAKIDNSETVDDWAWDYPEQGESNAKVFVERVLKNFMLAIVRCYEYGKDVERYKASVTAVEPPSQSVPDVAIG